MTAIAWVIGIFAGLFLLFRFPRQVGIAVAGIVAIGVLIWAYFANQQADAARTQALFTINAAADKTFCADPQYPILVSMQNGTSKTVNAVSFRLEGRMPGHSVATASDYLTSDVIMQPGYHYKNCWRISTYGGTEPDYWALTWSATVSYLTFG